MAITTLAWDLRGRTSHEVAAELQTQPNVRVTVTRYEPRQMVHGAMVAGRLYVLEGAINFSLGDSAVDLRAGESADFSPGSYCITPGDEGAVIAFRWQISEQFTPRDTNSTSD